MDVEAISKFLHDPQTFFIVLGIVLAYFLIGAFFIKTKMKLLFIIAKRNLKKK